LWHARWPQTWATSPHTAPAPPNVASEIAWRDSHRDPLSLLDPIPRTEVALKSDHVKSTLHRVTAPPRDGKVSRRLTTRRLWSQDYRWSREPLVKRSGGTLPSRDVVDDATVAVEVKPVRNTRAAPASSRYGACRTAARLSFPTGLCHLNSLGRHRAEFLNHGLARTV
jgi:hypothetical protein